MRTFRRIYYPGLAILFLLSLILTVALQNTGGGGSAVNSNAAFSHAQALTAIGARGQEHSVERGDARNYIANTLRDNGFAEAVVAGEDTSAIDNMPVVPTFFVTNDRLSGYYGGQFAVNIPVRNIIAVIPGSATRAANDYFGHAVAFVTNYDTDFVSGGTGNAGPAGALIQTAITLAAATPTTHDLVFVFTENARWGHHAFSTFEGFGRVVVDGDNTNIIDGISSRLRFISEFDARGNRGSLSLMTATHNAAAAFPNAGGGISAASVTGSDANSAYTGIPSLRFAALHDGGRTNSQLDTTPSRLITDQTTAAAYNLARHLGNHNNLATFGNPDANNAFFTYLNIPIRYPFPASAVLAVLVILLAGAVITFNILKTLKSGKGALGGAVGKIFKALLTQIIAIVIVAAALYIAYFLLSVIAMGFGVIVPQMVGTLVFGNAGVVIGAMLLATAIMAWVFILFKRVFQITSADMARGALVIWVTAAIITAFASVAFSYLFLIMALLQLTISLIRTLTKDAFKRKTGMSMDALLLPVVPLIFTLPILFPLLTLAMSHMLLIFIPLIFALFAAWAGFLLPYFSLSKAPLDKILGRFMPSYTIRYERSVVERIEDKAKRGKFKEVKTKKLFPEKKKLAYKNRYALSIIAIAAGITLVCSSFFAGIGAFGTARTTLPEDFHAAAYKDAFVYLWERDGTTSPQESWQIGEIGAYNHFRWAIWGSGFEWDDDRGVYTRALTTEEQYSFSIGTDRAPSIEPNKADPDGEGFPGRYLITPFRQGRSHIVITLTDAADVTEVNFFVRGNPDPIEIKIDEPTDTLTFEMPFGVDEFSIQIEEPGTVRLNYREYVFDTDDDFVALPNLVAIRERLGGRGITVPVRATMIFNYTNFRMIA